MRSAKCGRCQKTDGIVERELSSFHQVERDKYERSLKGGLHRRVGERVEIAIEGRAGREHATDTLP
jgi:hypothetical protein